MPAQKKKKAQFDDNKVHIEYAGTTAMFIRKIAFATGRSNNEIGHMLIDLIKSVHVVTTIEFKPGSQIQSKDSSKSVKLEKQAQTVIEIDFDG